MTNEILQEISCPKCQNPLDVREHGRHVVCDACSSRFILRGHLCPQCQTYHSDEAPFCGECGTAMQRVCIRCNSDNWAGDEFCVACGEALDIFEILALQQKDKRQEHMARRRAQIRALRAQEEAASTERMVVLEAEAAAYEAEMQRRRARKQAEDKRLLMLALGALILFILLVGTVAVATLF